MKKFRLIALALAAVFGLSAALAQVALQPQVATVGTADLFQDVVNGQPTANSQYATAAQIAGVRGYVYNVPLTAFTLTYANSQVDMILNPAGTLATGTLTTAPNPSDGQRECVVSSQTQTALTVTANTGQTIVNAPTALVANTPICWTFVKSLSAWERS